MADGDTSQDSGAQVTSVAPTTKERVLTGIAHAVGGATGASTAGVDAEIQKHQQARLNEAQMHRKNASTYTAILATGKDPTTGQPLSPEEEQKYKNWYNASMAAYEKAAGVNKETKGAIAKAKAIAEHVIGMGRKQREGAGGVAGGGGAGAQPAGLPPPPQRTAAVGARSSGDTGVDASPRTGGMTPPPGYTPQVAMAGDALRRQMDDARQVSQYQKKVDIDKAAKIEEAKATAAAKALNPSGAIRLASPLSLSEARLQVANGQQFLNAAGEPIDISKLDDTMQLVPVVQGHSVFYVPTSQRQTHLTVGNVTYAVPALEQTNIPKGAGTELGPAKTETTRRTTDPTTGQTTTSPSTPTITGAAGRGGLTAPPGAAARSGTAPAQKPSGAAAGPRASGNAVPTTSDGHIPQDWKGASPQVVEAANQLIDDRDVDKIPTKVRELGAALARKTGWFQGKFNPQQQAQMRTAVGFLEDLAKSPSLRVLDDTGSRLKLNQVLAGSDKQGAISGAFTTLASSSMTPAEADFVRQYNMAVQALSGMASFTRGGNKATEASVKRLLADLPNPKTVRDSKDARARLDLLLTEARRILQKGGFTEQDVLSPQGSQGTQGSKRLSAPPKGAGGGSSLDDEIKAAAAAARGGSGASTTGAASRP